MGRVFRGVRAILFFAGIMLLPVIMPAADYVLEEAVKPEVESFWSKDVKTSFRLMSKIGKVNVMTPKAENPAPVPSAADRELGFIPFERSYLLMTYYNYSPVETERKIGGLKIAAAPGRYESFALGIYPLEASQLTVTASDLSGNGAVIPAANIETGFLLHLLKTVSFQQQEVRPEMIKKGNTGDIYKGVTRTLWFTVKVPENAPAGVYQGTLTVTAGKKPFTEKISLEVLPIKLLEDYDFPTGWFGMPMDDETLKFAIEHGSNSVDSGLEPKMAYAGGKISLDFSRPAKRAEQLRRFGLEAYEHQIFLMEYASELMHTYGLKEFSPEFNKAFKEINAQLVKWFAGNKLRVVFFVVDEPREDVSAYQNRNYVDTVKYVKLCQEVPGVKTMVTPMADEHFGKDYTGFCDILDILSTHSYEYSSKMLNKCKNGAKAELWLYNSGRNRLSFGFNPWKWKAKGRREWAFAWGWTETVSKNFYSWSTYGGGDPACGVLYPTAYGPLSTPSLEKAREGTDDLKYIYTLECKIAAAKNSGNPEAVAAAGRAGQFLKALEQKIPEYSRLVATADTGNAGHELEEWRYGIAQEIIRLDKVLK